LVDEAVDCEKAIYYASRRAARIGGKVVLLRVIEPIYRNVEWLGVAETLQATARQEAQELLGKYTERASRLVNITPEAVIREGHPAEEIFRLIREDEDVAVLVLAAGSTQLGPGPLVSDLARTAGTYPIPISIVPAHLSYEELDALS
jgi:nucleotide-binding universal stress UspA family protein